MSSFEHFYRICPKFMGDIKVLAEEPCIIESGDSLYEVTKMEGNLIKITLFKKVVSNK